MKAIIVNNNPTLCRTVWTERVLDCVRAEVELDSEIHTKEDCLRRPELCREADFLLSTWGMPAFTEEEIRGLFPALKAVLYAAGSVQGFARPFLENGIAVHSAWAANGVPVAEYTVSQIILADKGFYQAQRLFKERRHEEARAHFNAHPGSYTGTTVGLIGIGMIGTMVARRLRDFTKVKVLGFDPFLAPEKAEELGLEPVSLEELFARSDVVSNHLANNPQTVGMLNYKLFSSMKPFATFINTGRGAQVVEPDLIRALEEEPGRTAVLDVTLPEPPEEDSPFYTLPNVFLSPHIAGSSGCEVERMAEYMEEELRARLAGEKGRWSVSLEMLKTMA